MNKTIIGRMSGRPWRKLSVVSGKPSIVFAALLAMCLAVLMPSAANAHGSLPIEEDNCARFMGRNIIHFSAYQPQFDKAGHYCEEIPKTGDTIVVVDLYNQRLRQVPVTLKIIDPSASEVEKVLVSTQPKIYSHGVIEAAATFPHSGSYQAIVTIADGDHEERSITFEVEPSKVMTYVSRGIIYAIVLILMGLLIVRPIWNFVQRRGGAT